MGKSIEYFHHAVSTRAAVPLYVLRWPRDEMRIPGVCIISHKMIPVLSDLLGQEEKRRWLFVDTVQGYGFPMNTWADLHMIGDPRLVNEYKESAVCGVPYTTVDDGGDFVSGDIFHPMPEVPLRYDIVMVASWAKFKNHSLLMDALLKLKSWKRSLSLLLVGSYCVPGHMPSMEEALSYERSIRRSIKERGLDVTIVGGEGSVMNDDGSTSLGRYGKHEVCQIINSAKLGVLTSLLEGTPRFAAECILCDRPLLLLEDLRGGARKYIMPLTGLLVENNATAVAHGMLELLERRSDLAPRKVFIERFGSVAANEALFLRLGKICPASQRIPFDRPYLGDLWGTDYYRWFLPNLKVVGVS